MSKSGIDKLATVLQTRMKSVAKADGEIVEFGTIDTSNSSLTLNSTGSGMVVPSGGYLTLSDLEDSGRRLVAWVGNTPVVIEGGSGGTSTEGETLTAEQQAALRQALDNIKV